MPLPGDDGEKIENITLYEEDFYASKEVSAGGIQILVFRLAQEWYGVNVLRIKVVMPIRQITCLPFAPAWIAGIINFRGEIMSVTDAKKILGLPVTELTEAARFVVVEAGSCRTALLADQAGEIITVPVDQIYSNVEDIAPHRAEYIEASCMFGQKLLGILNVERILRRN